MAPASYANSFLTSSAVRSTSYSQPMVRAAKSRFPSSRGERGPTGEPSPRCLFCRHREQVREKLCLDDGLLQKVTTFPGGSKADPEGRKHARGRRPAAIGRRQSLCE